MATNEITHYNIVVRTEEHFARELAERQAEGWEFNEPLMIRSHSDGGKVYITRLRWSRDTPYKG